MNTEFYSDLEQMLSDDVRNCEMIQQLCTKYNLGYDCVKSRIRRYREREGMLGTQTSVTVETPSTPSGFVCNSDFTYNDEPITRSIEYKNDGVAIFDRIISISNSEDLKPENILKAHGMDPSLWELLSCKSNFYQQQKKGGEILNLYQSKITVKPKVHEVSLDEVLENFRSLSNNFKPHKVEKQVKTSQKYMYEINIADLHLGKFAMDYETEEPLNSEIATRRFFELIDKEYSRIQELNGQVEKILFVWTNDFFNSDGISKATTGGTPQDTDMKWQQLYIAGVNMLIKAIDKLSELAPVKTFYIASNHSRQVDYYAICTLHAWFRQYENVEVDISPTTRHYERYGVNLIGFSHSYYEKKQNLPHLMSIERPRDWGQTKYREFHLAHYHCEKVEEVGGIIFRWLPSITGTDTWSNDCGYIGAVKRSYSFVYDKDKGLIQINSTIID